MLFVVTGGTIDKQPVLLPDGSFDNDSKVFDGTHLPEMFERAGFIGSRAVRRLFMVDSLDMTDAHRSLIRNAIEETDETKVVITHGTDTMPDTARYLARNKSLARRTIILTGAMVPYSMESVGGHSDALLNLCNAITYAHALSPGVYVAMNGQAFDADNVYKDVEAGVFREIE